MAESASQQTWHALKTLQLVYMCSALCKLRTSMNFAHEMIRANSIVNISEKFIYDYQVLRRTAEKGLVQLQQQSPTCSFFNFSVSTHSMQKGNCACVRVFACVPASLSVCVCLIVCLFTLFSIFFTLTGPAHLSRAPAITAAPLSSREVFLSTRELSSLPLLTMLASCSICTHRESVHSRNQWHSEYTERNSGCHGDQVFCARRTLTFNPGQRSLIEQQKSD